MKIIILILSIFVCSTSQAVEISGLEVENMRIYQPRLMMFGDSITRGIGDDNEYGFRDHLQDLLTTNYLVVGSYAHGDAPYVYVRNHDGVSSERTDQIEARVPNALSRHLRENDAEDIILVYAGANDISQSVPTQTAVDNVEDIIDIIHAYNPNIAVYVGLLHPRQGAESEITTYITTLNSMLKAYSKNNLYVVDMNTAFYNDVYGLCSGDWANNCLDAPTSSHPNDTGYQVLARKWAACINDGNCD